ncbi:MAG: OmpA family protein [Anaerohalosphaeraceae bacterium]
MKTSRIWVVATLAAVAIAASGCVSQAQLDDLKAQNRIQQDRIAQLESQLGDCNQTLDQKNKELQSLTGKSGADLQAKNAYIAALEADLEQKKAMIAKLQEQLLQGGAPLPMEMNVLLKDFASRNPDLVSFDEASGSLKFKSDLLFNPGSDEVATAAAGALKTLAGIMNQPEAKQFDMAIVGHTDDLRISRADTKQKHPTNWHLSVHRAISVLNILAQNQITEDRMCAKGYGEFRPAEPNKTNKQGNPANRRVEIFIIPSSR